MYVTRKNSVRSSRRTQCAAIRKTSRCILYREAMVNKLSGIHKCTVWTKCRVLHLGLMVRNGNHQALKGGAAHETCGRKDRQT